MSRDLQSRLREFEPLAPLTTWKIGGSARWLVSGTREQIGEAVEVARRRSINVVFLGRGSNVLVADEPINALVVHTAESLVELRDEEGVIIAEAGVSLPRLARHAFKLGYRGYEFLVGIPGTVGGAICMNAGLTVFRKREVADVLLDVEVLKEDGRIEWLTPEQLEMGYRSSKLIDHNWLVLRARFRPGDPGDPDAIHQSALEHLAERKRKQPLHMPTAGSTFKQPKDGKSAAFYIEQCGLKGRRVGGAEISRKHANWIENLGGARAADVKQLISTAQEAVAGKFGVQLEREVRYLEADGRWS